jgi:hypothetical protein
VAGLARACSPTHEMMTPVAIRTCLRIVLLGALSGGAHLRGRGAGSSDKDKPRGYHARWVRARELQKRVGGKASVRSGPAQ